MALRTVQVVDDIEVDAFLIFVEIKPVPRADECRKLIALAEPSAQAFEIPEQPPILVNRGHDLSSCSVSFTSRSHALKASSALEYHALCRWPFGHA